MVRLASGSGVSVSVLLSGVGSVGLLTVAVLTTSVVKEAAACTISVNTWAPSVGASVVRVAVIVPFAPAPVLSVRVQPAGTVSVFFNDTATTEIYTLSLHDALPILFDSVIV